MSWGLRYDTFQMITPLHYTVSSHYSVPLAGLLGRVSCHSRSCREFLLLLSQEVFFFLPWGLGFFFSPLLWAVVGLYLCLAGPRDVCFSPRRGREKGCGWCFLPFLQWRLLFSLRHTRREVFWSRLHSFSLAPSDAYGEDSVTWYKLPLCMWLPGVLYLWLSY